MSKRKGKRVRKYIAECPTCRKERRVREVWETKIVSSAGDAYLHLYVPAMGKMYVTKGFMAGDRVRVTVERLAPRKGGKK